MPHSATTSLYRPPGLTAADLPRLRNRLPRQASGTNHLHLPRRQTRQSHRTVGVALCGPSSPTTVVSPLPLAQSTCDWLSAGLMLPHTPNLSASDHTFPSGNSLLHCRPGPPPLPSNPLCSSATAHRRSRFAMVPHPADPRRTSRRVFDLFSGYGRSSGSIHWTQCEQDTFSSFACLRRSLCALPSLFLASLSDRASPPQVVNNLPIDRLILCASFTTFAEAAHAVGVPRSLARLIPPIWDAKETLAVCARPILVVHSTNDRLFPVAMAHELVSYCRGNAKLHLLLAKATAIPSTNPNNPSGAPSSPS